MNNDLPDDIEQLNALLLAQQAVIVRLSGEINGYAREIDSLRALVAKHSENAVRPQQQRENPGESRIEDRAGCKAYNRAPEQAWRNPIATHLNGWRYRAESNKLPRPQSDSGNTSPGKSGYPPAETECPVSNRQLKPLSESISEQLDIINTAFRVIETVRPKLVSS